MELRPRRLAHATHLAVLPLLLAAWLVPVLAQDRPSDQPVTLGATYDELSVEQRTLLDGFFARAGAILGVTLDPRQRYDSAPLSSRTTFDAITHALLRSVLTDRRSGQPLGRTIDLIDHVEAIRGQVPGASGDQQFRVYVTLKPGARDTLDDSAEFRRAADNAFYHQGYPTSYRQDGRPSIQVSITQDGSRADLDVDYRSSMFPVSLINGHLSAANSDIRAGNLDRHNGRWSGLFNWWDGFIEPLFAPDVEVPQDAPKLFPSTPRAGSKTIDLAVDDFLTSWLVEGQPNLALAYVDPAAYDCLAARLEQEGKGLERGLAPLQLFVRMRKVNELVGPRASLTGTTRGLRRTDPALKIVTHKRPDQYSIYGVPKAMADRMSCASDTAFGPLPPAPVGAGRREVYENFLSTVVIGPPGRAATALGLFWQRRDGHWKIVSYQAVREDVPGPAAMPDLTKPAAPVTAPRLTAGAELLQTNEQFLDAWLVRRNVDEAMAILSPEAYACVNLYLDPAEPPKASVAEQSARLRAGLERVSRQAGAVTRLEDVAERVVPSDPRLRIVEQPRQAFHLLGVPDWMGPTLSCEARLARGDTAAAGEAEDKAYGQYYLSALRFLTNGEPGPVLALGWLRADDRWRIFSFKVIEP